MKGPTRRYFGTPVVETFIKAGEIIDILLLVLPLFTYSNYCITFFYSSFLLLWGKQAHITYSFYSLKISQFNINPKLIKNKFM